MDAPEAIYKRPEDYDLEHVGDTDDIRFFLKLATRLRPRKVLELACGDGRVTVPLAELGATNGFQVAGLEIVPEMLEAARLRSATATARVQQHLTLHPGDMRDWRLDSLFDLILTPCSSMCHLLTLDDQLAAWRCAYTNLEPGGRFVVDVTMADLGSYVDSVQARPREIVEVDLDTFDEPSQTRLIRYRTTKYAADEQRAKIRFLYDKYVGTAQPEHSVSDFESHVYYPREMRLLFQSTGFRVDEVYGDYYGGALKPGSPQMIFVGLKPQNAEA